MKMILGKKIGMTRIFGKDSEFIPVTLISAGPCYITQIKSAQKEGYNSLQLGFAETKKQNKAQKGHFKKANKKLENIRYSQEIRVSKDEIASSKLGSEITAAIFKQGEIVDITGVSKGKGFAGTVKRHHFTLGPKTHGSDNYRRPGSIGCMYPERVIKGKRMSGHLGAQKTTIKNLNIIEADKNSNLIVVKGAVPGPKNTLLIIKGK